MRTMTESLILHLLIFILTVEFSDVRTSPLSSDPRIPYPSGRSQMSEHFQIKQPSDQTIEPPGRQITRVKTVAVICHENYMEIAIKADLFVPGQPVDASELRLGADSQFIPSCKVTAFSTSEYIITAEFTDWAELTGTQHWMARAVMKTFPAVPEISFGTAKKEMANERKTMALQILKASVFNEATNCAMCSMAKPIGPGPPLTKWIQCESCDMWFHEECLDMAEEDLEQARAAEWNCSLCC